MPNTGNTSPVTFTLVPWDGPVGEEYAILDSACDDFPYSTGTLQSERAELRRIAGFGWAVSDQTKEG